MNRRNFLYASVATAASMSARSYGGILGANDRVGLGIIGLGRHTRNFIDAIVAGAQVNAPLKAGLEASLPVQMALHSYWPRKTVSQAQLL